MVPLNWYLGLAIIMFVLGAIGVLTRRNVLIILMCIELMLNSANLVLVAFGRFLPNVNGQVLVFFVMAIAAAEVAVGLALVVTLFRHHQSVDVEKFSLMKW